MGFTKLRSRICVISHPLPDDRLAPIAFPSGKFSKAERNYAQFDRKGLAMI